jgi:AraC-like DNA-binding protein
MKVGILDIILIIMIFQLLVFSFFLFIRKARFISNYILGIQLFSQAAGIFNGFCFNQYEYFYNSNPHLFFVGSPFTFLWGPTFYLYVKSVSYKDFKLKFNQLPHFLPFVIMLLFFLITFYPFSAEEKRIILNDSSYAIFTYRKFIDVFIRVQVLSYIILSIYVLHSVKEKLKDTFSSISETHLSWIQFLVIGFTTSYILTIPLIIFSYIFHYKSPTIYLFIIAPYFIYFNIIFFRAWYKPDIFTGVEEEVKYKSSKLTKEEAENWINKLTQHVVLNKPYLNPEFTLNQLAENTNIPPRILSQIINEYFNQNFYDYVNKLRIEESKKFLLDSSNKKTILEILYTVGFNSKSSYNVAFKKNTGLTPTEFRRKVNQIK